MKLGMFTMGAATESKTDLEGLLQQYRVMLGKFKEHTTLVRNATADPHLQVFFDHLLEEEDEHAAEVDAMLAAARKIQSNQNHNHPVFAHPTDTELHSGNPDRTTGHFAARDQNILTVGSLLGCQQ
jgi:hypothetical protein